MGYRDAYEKWLRDFADDKATHDELLSIAGDEKEIEDRFYTGLSFGTAGMRGVLGAGENRMNIYNVPQGDARPGGFTSTAFQGRRSAASSSPTTPAACRRNSPRRRRSCWLPTA